MRILKYKNRTHLLAIDFGLFALFCLGTIISPPTNTGEAQTIKVLQKIKETTIKYDSTDAIIKVKLDSLELNTEKLKESTDLTLKTTAIMKRQHIELRKHTKLIDQIENKLKYDSLELSDKNKLNLAKKKDSVSIQTNIIGLPCIEQPEVKRKGFFKRIFHCRKK